jgi:hypothetical protein
MTQPSVWTASLDWRLVLSLSLFGPAMGLASILGWTGSLEGPLWAVIALLAAFAISREAPGRHFLHGLLTGAIGGTSAPLLQSLMFKAYLDNNPALAADFGRMQIGMDPRLFVLALAPMIGIVSGLVLGLLTLLAGRVIPRAY